MVSNKGCIVEDVLSAASRIGGVCNGGTSAYEAWILADGAVHVFDGDKAEVAAFDSREQAEEEFLLF